MDVGVERVKAYERDLHVPRMAAITGLLYGCGAAFVVASALLPHPPSVDETGLWAIAVVAAITSIVITSESHRFTPNAIHAVLLLGSALIALCVYFSGTTAGLYAVMYVWVVLVSARSFSIRGLGLQLAGIACTYAGALATLETGPTEFSVTTRWMLTVFALSVTGLISLRLAEDAKKREAELVRLSRYHERAASRAQPAKTRSLTPH